MSGGVDSSVTAALLLNKGYDVIGITMKLFAPKTTDLSSQIERGCCNIDAVHRAESVCHTLNIPHYSVDLIDKFQKHVIDDFSDEYIAGRTPNPCVRCNAFLKWGSLLRKAELLERQYLATGHYARIDKVGDEYHLLRAENHDKDQVYALWGIPADALSKTLFPLGSLRKEKVREIASSLDLKSAQTPESQEICFIPGNDYAEFLRGYRPDFFTQLQPGDLIEETSEDVKKVGEHAGYPFYTIGQRRGLGGGFPDPRYVNRIDPQTNRVYIGTKERLFSKRFEVDQINWLIASPHSAIVAEVQIRYRSPAVPALIYPKDDSVGAIIEFEEPVEAITPGQSAVFFQSDRLIGGGRITIVADPN